MRKLGGTLLVVGAILASACSEPKERELLAFSDEVARQCGELATRLAEAWEAMEATSQRKLSFAEAELAYLDGTRKQCAAALALLDELDGERPRLPGRAETHLRALLALDRLLLETLEDPDMPSDVFSATQEGFQKAYPRSRGFLRDLVPMTAEEQRSIAGRLLPRWDAQAEVTHVSP